MSTELPDMRWDPYVLVTDEEFDRFWQRHLSGQKRDILFIVGRGFDIRATLASKRVCGLAGDNRCDAWLLGFENGLPDSDLRARLTAENVQRYQLVFANGSLEELAVRLSTSGNKAGTSRNVSRVIQKHKAELLKYDDVVIDISAMPRMVAMTVLVQVLYLLDEAFKRGGKDTNLHVLTAESVSSDRGATQASLSDTVASVVGFSGELNSEVTEHIPRVWFPVLGEDQSTRLTRIREELRPDEICPVIPFPSKEARRGDEIIAAYRQTLFDDFQIEPGNILHASEFNPFEAYKQLYWAIDRYRDSLNELGGCKAYVSPLSSKLLSVGAVLACYDHRRMSDARLKIGIPYVEAASYGEPTQPTTDGTELYSMWIRGEWER